MPNTKFKKGSPTYRELTDGLPKYFDFEIDWDDVSSKCDVNRRNCALSHAFSSRDDITRPSVGFDAINFIWKGDARIAIAPGSELAGIIARNDLAAAGEMPWPTGKQTVRVGLHDAVLKKDLRVGRVRARQRREEMPEVIAAEQKRSRDSLKHLDYKARAAKRLETERLRGRFS